MVDPNPTPAASRRRRLTVIERIAAARAEERERIARWHDAEARRTNIGYNGSSIDLLCMEARTKAHGASAKHIRSMADEGATDGE